MPHILFMMSDTGGGHRAACRAMEAALTARYPGRFTYEMVDMWKDYTPFPFSTAPQMYTRWVNLSPATYAAQFWVADRLFQQDQMSRLYCEGMYPRMQRFYEDHPADIIVCAHSVFVRPAIYALRRANIRIPFVTVITDYALPTVLWYDPQVDRCLIPTEPAFRRGLKLGIPPEQMVLTGAPVHPRFAELTMSKADARRELGLNPNARIILLVGGGDGMGPLVATARAIDRRKINAELVIIAGRNEALKAALESHRWKRPTHICGFVNNMPVFMRASDLLITKAGPATITEAATIGTPMVLSGAIKYQESPNVEYVVKHGAGIYAPGPQRVARRIETLLKDGDEHLEKLATRVRRLADPDAIWNIADEIARFA